MEQLEAIQSFGSGSGYGNGYGEGEGENAKLYFSALLSSVQSDSTRHVFWRSNLDGTPANGGTGGPRKVGMVETVYANAPVLCGSGALHGTLNPKNWKGDRWWIVGLYAPIVGDDDKMGSTKRVILKDLGRCPF